MGRPVNQKRHTVILTDRCIHSAAEHVQWEGHLTLPGKPSGSVEHSPAVAATSEVLTDAVIVGDLGSDLKLL